MRGPKEGEEVNLFGLTEEEGRTFVTLHMAKKAMHKAVSSGPHFGEGYAISEGDCYAVLVALEMALAPLVEKQKDRQDDIERVDALMAEQTEITGRW